MSSKPESVINSCPSCGEPIDVTALMPYAKIECPHCDEAVRIRTQLGKYSITGRLGEGGMSQVFRAKDSALNREVALKILHQELSQDEKLTALFEREAQLTASINHPNVVKVYTVGREGAYFFIAMELVDNISLEKVLEKDGALSERDALDLLYDVTKGLRAAFQNALIHRDIKPGNMLMTQGGIGKLVDFGLAIIQDDEDEMEDLWATPFYVPPEKLDGDPDDFRGDIYSLGATFFHALAGKPPFAANTSSIEELKRMKKERVSLADYAPKVSAPFVKLIDRMMAYEPVRRPQGYDELLELIGEVQEESGEIGGIAARDRRENAIGTAGSGGAVKWIGIAALLFIGIISGVMFLSGDGSSGDTTDAFDFTAGGGDRVIAAGETNAAIRYLAARDLLQKGAYVKAENEFTMLIKSDDLRQPTLAWTQLHVGLSALLGGREKPSRKDFLPLATSEGFVESEAGLREFFQKIGGPLSEPLPVTAEEVAELDRSSHEVLGLFLYGLKNWQLEQFENGKKLLQQFRQAEVPIGYEWIKDYQAQVEPFLKDAKLLESLPNPTNQPIEALQKIRQQLQKSADGFETRGSAPSLVRRRAKRAEDLIASLKAIPKPSVEPTPEVRPEMTTTATSDSLSQLSDSITEKAVGEVAYLANSAKELTAKATPENLAEMLETWESLEVETPVAARVKNDEQVAWIRALEFDKRARETLAGGEWEGDIPLKNGEVFNAKVVEYSEEGVVLDFGFGVNDAADLPLDEVAPEFFLSVCGDVLDDSAIDPEPLAEAAFYARQLGFEAEANFFAQRTIELLPNFETRWTRLNTFMTAAEE